MNGSHPNKDDLNGNINNIELVPPSPDFVNGSYKKKQKLFMNDNKILPDIIR